MSDSPPSTDPLLVPIRVTWTYTAAQVRRHWVAWVWFVALMVLWGAASFAGANTGRPLGDDDWSLWSDLVLGPLVTVVSVVLKVRVLRANGHTRLRERGPVAVAIQQVQFVFPCLLVGLGAVVLVGILGALWLPTGGTPSMALVGLVVLAVAPFILPYLFIGEVAVFGVTDKTREALALSRAMVRANLALVTGSYALAYVVPLLTFDNDVAGVVLVGVTAVTSATFLVVWTSAFGDSLRGPTDLVPPIEDRAERPGKTLLRRARRIGSEFVQGLVVAHRGVIRWLYHAPGWMAGVGVFCVSFLLQVLAVALVPEGFLFDTGTTPMGSGLDPVVVGVVLVAAPLLETLVGFTLLHSLAHRVFKLRTSVPFVVGGTLLFAAAHWYSASYIVSMAACAYPWYLYYAVLRHRGRNGFVPVALIHFARNAVAVAALGMQG